MAGQESAFDGWELVRGVREPPAHPIALRAGELTLNLTGIEVQSVRRGSVEVLRRLQVAVRDVQWGTVPAVVEDWNLSQDDRSFHLSFLARHVRQELDFCWHGRILGTADGEISYTLEGEARSSFDYGRIGIVALHPPEVSGRRYVAQYDGSVLRGRIPDLITSQKLIDGFYQPMVGPYRGLTLHHPSGLRSTMRFHGDDFEMEDQRNWTDASFKTYSTPLSMGIRHTAIAGSRISQEATLLVRRSLSFARRATVIPPDTRVEVGRPLSGQLPGLGFSLPRHGQQIPRHQLELLARLQPAHLRVDLGSPTTELKRLELAVETAMELSTDVELVLGVDRALTRTGDLTQLLGRVRVARIMLVDGPKGVVGAEQANRARSVLHGAFPNVPVYAGTAGQFVALNQEHVSLQGVSGVGYTITPQMHAFDDLSLIENLEAQADTVLSASALSGGAAVIVGPVTLRPQSPRFETQGALPSDVDPRQMSLLGAAWTLGSVSKLSHAGASSVTYFELNGWRGLLESLDGPPMAAFPSHAGMIFPVFHVFAALAGWRGSQLTRVTCSRQESIAALPLMRGNKLRVLVANLRDCPQAIALTVSGAADARVAMIDETSKGVTTRADLVDTDMTPVDSANGTVRLHLRPYALAVVDAEMT